MKEKLVQLSLRWSEEEWPILDTPDDARVRIRVIDVSPEVRQKDEERGVTTLKEVVVEGNRSGLTALARLLLLVAETDLPGYHLHLDPEANAPFYRSDENYWLRIDGLSKGKREK